ncbi:hypothetical protein BDZ91DRAFT_709766, partial [Kalaharituber pfeilii]
RDWDLMDADDYLSESKLDSLWEWFCAANEEKLDLQMIFVKLVNTARKLYRSNVLSHRLPSSGSSHYTPTLCETPQQSHESHKLAIAETLLQAKEAKIQDLQESFLHIEQEQQQHKKKESGLTHVALKSVHFSDKYIQMRNDGVWVATSIGLLETFELVQYLNGIVSFKSTCYPDTYLSVDASGVRPVVNKTGENESCITCGNAEKFRIQWSGDGKQGIKPVNFERHFLGLNGHDGGGVFIQDHKSLWGAFHIVVLK